MRVPSAAEERVCALCRKDLAGGLCVWGGGGGGDEGNLAETTGFFLGEEERRI